MGGPVRDHMQRLFTAPGQEFGRLAAFVSLQARIWRFCAQRLHENNLFAMSAALSFQTIFALIPALVLALLAAGALGVLEDSKSSLRQFLEASGFAEIVAVQEGDGAATQPISGTATQTTSSPGSRVINVANEIERVVANVQNKLTFEKIGPIGALLFIWSALSLLSTMEDSLNRVFGAARNRAVARRVLLYWSTMTLGPVLLAAAIFLGSRAIHAAQGMPILSSIVVLLGWFGPTLVGVLVLAAVYILLPNTRVNADAAIGGAVAAAIIWLAARWAFALYVERFVVKGNLYGILGVLPLFFMWLNFSWLIFLFGAELAHTAANLKRMTRGVIEDRTILTSADALAAVLAVAKPFHAGAGPVGVDRVVSQTGLSDEAALWLLERLTGGGVLCHVRGDDGDRYALAMPLELIRVADVLRIAGQRTESKTNGANGTMDALLTPIQNRMLASVEKLTLAEALQAATNGDTPPAV